jgi:hypothetical protein
VASRKRLVLNDEIHRFFDLFDPTIALVERLIAAEENAQEVLLLLSARLDALASSISSEDKSSRDSFTRLIIAYGGERQLMESVSAGDLYYEIGFHRWLMEGMLPKPGRIVRFSRIDDPMIELLELSDIPLSVDAARALLTRLMKSVGNCCRCRPRQPLNKPSTLSSQVLTEAVEREFKHSRTVEVDKLSKAIQPLLRSKAVAGLLYENFRNAAVHGIKVELDESRFFAEPRPFWQPLYSEYYPPFMTLKFSGPFLLKLLRNCLRTLREAWLAKGKVPPDVHWHLFGYGLDKLHLLDADLLPEARSLRIQRYRS